jgi:hypothetical protein
LLWRVLRVLGLSLTATGACGFSGRRISVNTNLSQAAMKGRGVLDFSPMPMTVSPPSRRRVASRVKSLSDDTRQKPSKLPVYSKSMASMMRAESVEFLPLV